jgi:flagellar protein FlaG
MNIDSLKSLRPTDTVASRDAPQVSAKIDHTSSPSNAEPAQPAAEPTRHELDTAVTKINKALAERAQSLEFSVDQDSNRTIVKVIDQNTQEVIRQIPSQETLDIAKALESAQGMLIKQKA